MGLLSTNDVYTGSVNPDATVNPKTIGAMWVNYTTGVTFICKDNTKDKNVWENNVYPVGSCFITIKDGVDPNKIYGGTWKLEGGDRALWSSSSDGGSYISPGLPNITGKCSFYGGNVVHYQNNGCFYSGAPSYYRGNGSDAGASSFTFDASRSNPIYGSSTTVQPPAIKIYLWIRTA